MAINTTGANNPKMEFAMQIKRQGPFSLDPTDVWPSLEAAEEYARTNPTAIVGQQISAIVDGEAVPYVIVNEEGKLSPMIGISNENIATDSEVDEMLNEIFSSEISE